MGQTIERESVMTETANETNHPLHDKLMAYLTDPNISADRAPLPHEIRERIRNAALRGVLEIHSPAFGIGKWITCSECCNQAWPPPEPMGSGIWHGTEYPCATALAVAEALGLG